MIARKIKYSLKMVFLAVVLKDEAALNGSPAPLFHSSRIIDLWRQQYKEREGQTPPCTLEMDWIF